MFISRNAFFLFLCLLIPTKRIDIYIIAVTIAVSTLYARVSIRIVPLHWVILTAIIFIFSGTIVRFFIGMPFIRDYLEITKFVPPFILLAYYSSFRNFCIEDVLKAFLIFIFLDAGLIIIDLFSL